MLEEITTQVNKLWSHIEPDSPPPQKIHYIGMPGSLEGGTISLLGFVDKRDIPSFFVKIARTPRANTYIKNESLILQAIHKYSAEKTITGEKIGVPVLYHSEYTSDKLYSYLITSVLTGKPMGVNIAPKNKLPTPKKSFNDFSSVYNKLYMIREFSLQTNAIKDIQNSIKTINLIQYMDKFRQIYSLSDQEEKLCKEIENIITHKINFLSPIIIHGDYCRQNFLITPNHKKTFIIDWSFTSLMRAPLHDAFFFAATYFLQSARKEGIAGFIENFYNTFINSNDYSLSVVMKNLLFYSKQIGISSDEIFYHLCLFLIVQSVTEYERTVACAEDEGMMPGITMYLASSSAGNNNSKPYSEALKEQYWVYYFKEIVRDENRIKVEQLLNKAKRC